MASRASSRSGRCTAMAPDRPPTCVGPKSAQIVDYGHSAAGDHGALSAAVRIVPVVHNCQRPRSRGGGELVGVGADSLPRRARRLGRSQPGQRALAIRARARPRASETRRRGRRPRRGGTAARRALRHPPRSESPCGRRRCSPVAGERIDVLRRGRANAHDRPAWLVHACVQVDLGTALRHQGHPTEARSVLAGGLDAGSACGALRLAARARAELASGGRPRPRAPERPGGAGFERAPRSGARRPRLHRRPDRAGAVLDRQDRRDAPRTRLPETRDLAARTALRDD
jgi:hypothetical protein